MPELIDDPYSDAFRDGRELGRMLLSQDPGWHRVHAAWEGYEESSRTLSDPLARMAAWGTAMVLRERLEGR